MVTKSIKFTYLELGKAKVAHFDMEAIIYQNIVTLDIPMYNAEAVHVLEHHCRIPGDR